MHEISQDPFLMKKLIFMLILVYYTRKHRASHGCSQSHYLIQVRDRYQSLLVMQHKNILILKLFLKYFICKTLTVTCEGASYEVWAQNLVGYVPV